ncbi:Protein SapB [bioreactor metagenome]|uniref:Protein SapB n=1 Tax=bioreactor metagenome TaxID=1076179 RepID=A0A645CUQ0_9ZZZZ
MISEVDVLIRLMMALFLGGLIGYERQACNKAAGLRTHVLVCIGSCLIMVLSINIYYSVQGLTNADPVRLAAQVVSGIGFLGAGTIMKEGPAVKGLTTAASLWVVSGVGLAIGSGYYISAVLATGLVFLTLSALSRFEKWVGHIGGAVSLLISAADKPGQIGRVCSRLGDYGLNIKDIKVEGCIDHNLILAITLNSLERLDITTVVANLMEVEGVFSVKVE